MLAGTRSAKSTRHKSCVSWRATKSCSRGSNQAWARATWVNQTGMTQPTGRIWTTSQPNLPGTAWFIFTFAGWLCASWLWRGPCAEGAGWLQGLVQLLLKFAELLLAAGVAQLMWGLAEPTHRRSPSSSLRWGGEASAPGGTCPRDSSYCKAISTPKQSFCSNSCQFWVQTPGA